MFDFKWKVKNSFRNVRNDIDEFKENINDWIVFLDSKDQEIEKRLDKMEDRIDRIEEAMFNILSVR